MPTGTDRPLFETAPPIKIHDEGLRRLLIEFRSALLAQVVAIEYALSLPHKRCPGCGLRLERPK